jgi:alkyl sulfatase BDS1-like metallo-beta-lactamase superfamily hydrolase
VSRTMSRISPSLAPLLVLLCVLTACDSPAPQPSNTEASAWTAKRNREVASQLDLADPVSFERVKRGLVAAPEPSDVRYPVLGGTPRTLADFAYLEGDAPDTVHPSLWRQAKLNNHAGLYRVTEGVHQLRGFDLANMTLIDSDNGWIVVDPLTTSETSRDALAFARKHLGDKPVTAIIYTHSHADHFGGVLGVMTPEEARERKIPIVAPVGFTEASTKENMVAGPAMLRRVAFVYGHRLEPGPAGHVGIGLGKYLGSGVAGILSPTQSISKTGQSIVLDGVKLEFQMALGSEAPSEFMFYLPDLRAFCGAEVVSMTMHNVYTLRGAKVRDAQAWGDYIDEAIARYPNAEVYFGSHHWPVWGSDEIVDFLAGQRDLYRYIHDQTLRMANQGMTPQEIAEAMVLPESLTQRFDLRGYYGSIKHNVKAVYSFYFGWYDGNPAHIDPLPRSAAASRYVEIAGGQAEMLARGQESYDAGEYRWAAELLNHLVFANEDNDAARTLLAETYRQLAYQSESTQWRNSYLIAAVELEAGIIDGPGLADRASETILANTPLANFFDTLAVSLDGLAAAETPRSINVVFKDVGQSFVLEITNGVLHHRERPPSKDADATLELTHSLFLRMIRGNTSPLEILTSDEISLDGSALDTARFFSLIKPAKGNFPIVTP